jgi:hypothetical protein
MRVGRLSADCERLLNTAGPPSVCANRKACGQRTFLVAIFISGQKFTNLLSSQGFLFLRSARGPRRAHFASNARSWSQDVFGHQTRNPRHVFAKSPPLCRHPILRVPCPHKTYENALWAESANYGIKSRVARTYPIFGSSVLLSLRERKSLSPSEMPTLCIHMDESPCLHVK